MKEILKQNWQLLPPFEINGRRVTADQIGVINTLDRTSRSDVPLTVDSPDISQTTDIECETDLVTEPTPRSDSRRSLWTTILGSIGQAAFAVGSFVAGLPVEVWLGAALIIAVLIIVYLYRQITLGRIRESKCAACNANLQEEKL